MGAKTILQRGFEGQAKAMREFGYPDVTAETIAAHHAAWLKGEELPDVVFHFSTSAFEEYPMIFGTRALSASSDKMPGERE